MILPQSFASLPQAGREGVVRKGLLPRGAQRFTEARTADDPTSESLFAPSAPRRWDFWRVGYCTISVTMSGFGAAPTAVAVTVICQAPNLVGVAKFTRADPGAVAAADVAVTVAVAGLGTTAGAVYSPLASTVPFAFPPATAQVTLWFAELFTVAENCCWVSAGGQELPASSANRVADPGFTETVGGGPLESLPVTPPQEISVIHPIPKQTAAIQTRKCGLPHVFRVTPTIPATSQASAKQGKMRKRGQGWGPRCAGPGRPRAAVLTRAEPSRAIDCAPFGPVVVTVSVTVVVPAAAASEGGLNPQFVSAGEPEHAKLTAALNVPPPEPLKMCSSRFVPRARSRWDCPCPSR